MSQSEHDALLVGEVMAEEVLSDDSDTEEVAKAAEAITAGHLAVLEEAKLAKAAMLDDDSNDIEGDDESGAKCNKKVQKEESVDGLSAPQTNEAATSPTTAEGDTGAEAYNISYESVPNCIGSVALEYAEGGEHAHHVAHLSLGHVRKSMGSYCHAVVDAMPEEEFIGLYTRLLLHICDDNQLGSYLPDKLDPISIFYSTFKQPFSMQSYVERIFAYANCSRTVFVNALIYLDRLRAADSRLGISQMNIHRVFLTAVVLSIKSLEDELYQNCYFAKIGGIPTVAEFNQLEEVLLATLKWRMHVTYEEYSVYENELGIVFLCFQAHDVPYNSAAYMGYSSPVSTMPTQYPTPEFKIPGMSSIPYCTVNYTGFC